MRHKQMAKSKITSNARKSHEKKRPFECDICNAEFTENTLFIDHISKKFLKMFLPEKSQSTRKVIYGNSK